MHPDPRFAWRDEEAMLAFIAERAFCTIFCAAGEGAAVFHVPVVVNGPARIRFHVARSNRGAAALEGARVLLSCLGPDAYISPDWYGAANQVPTWNYVAVEAEGPLRRLEESELIALLDDLSEQHERRLAPKPVWTRDETETVRFDGALKAIVGYEIAVEELRGTRKLGQNKRVEELEGAAAGLEAAGHAAIADLMRSGG
jgi:transcriptional regulator